MDNVDANLIAVQWGLIGVFGVVVGLLIAPADKFLQAFLSSAESKDQKRAARWADSLRVTSTLVLMALVGLSVVGARDAGLRRADGFAIGFWLLLTPVLAQAGFVILVLCLVKPVPRLLTLHLNPPRLDPSPGGMREGTVICFINETSVEMRVWWLNFDGNKDDSVTFSVPALGHVPQLTYQGHLFLVAVGGVDRCTVEAAATPCRAVITAEDPTGGS